MSFTSWFRPGGARKDGAAKGSQAEAAAAVRTKQRDDLQDAMKWTALIMNDDIDGAWAGLQKGRSAFHGLGVAITFFMRSMLGSERQVMADTVAKLADCEATAAADSKTVQRHATALASGRLYPPGTEYDLVRAQTHLMGAVVSVMNESIVEAMRGFYKLRKAFVILDAIVAIEARAADSAAAGQAPAPAGGSNGKLKTEVNDSESSGDSEAFVDAQETSPPAIVSPPVERAESSSIATTPEPNGDNSGPDGATSSLPLRPRSSAAVDSPPDLDDPIDEFIHSGTNMCFGLLLLVLSLVPPSFSRILSVVGFRGDRAKGIRLLWRSAAHHNVHGALSGMMLLGYYNGLLGAVDIVPADADYDAAAESVGPPREKCAALLADMRARYPASQLWRVEEARLLASRQRLGEAIDVLRRSDKSQMKQLAALEDFDLAMYAMVAQDWVLMRDSFLRCQESSDWSPAMYYYSAGCATLELYRDAVQRGEDTAALKAEAEEYLRKAPQVAGRKRVMARQLPIETFLQRKVAKWEERAKLLGVDLADAVGASPALELCYVWSGHRRMGAGELERAVGYLRWERCTAGGEAAGRISAEEDEGAVWAVCMAVLLRSQGKLDEARGVLEDKVFAHDRSVFKGPNKEDYLVPAATHELGVIAWAECCRPPPPDSSITPREMAAYRRERLDECQAQLDKARGWEPFSLEARLGMRVQCGLETVRWLRPKLEGDGTGPG
ncbi:mitochondrial outer membrane protein [Hirsutella rhossiliensis]|uniref:Inclusion body clearance protein IML2 n=1 Tax=Hirsutella rhossiliensis TaxID=111463 RepID=A0A9P8N7N7_9HYPO|nr:mitochondrial outer membrane protein [Hirsutella rhossiliensis]KAH0968490.1 mitochondrial outer membrane protein [Hirsutella rhossiliensis]